jgi:chemotaxis protein methyltransferase CheR
LGDATLAQLVCEAVDERDAYRRRRVLLARLPANIALDTVAEQVVEAALDDVDVARREAALDVTWMLGRAALPLLRRLIAHRSARTRRLAIDALARLGDEGADVVVTAFSDPLLAVRACAVDAYARAAGVGGVPTLLRLLDDAEVSATIALAALLGVESAGATCPRALLSRWLADPLTAAVALRLAGKAGDVEALLPALAGASPQLRRAAVVGLADALGTGARLVDVVLAREPLLAAAADADVAVAEAAIVVLAYAGDVDGLVAVARGEGGRLLSALHRAVSTLDRAQQAALLERLERDPLPGDVARELIDALQRRRAGGSATRGEADFDAVAAWFEGRLGLSLDRASHARLRARLSSRIDALAVESLGRYLERLQRDPAEAAAAFDLVTIHETYFFRERPQLSALRDVVVPTLAASGRRRLRVWSAGCSTGEEAWTIAVLLDDAVRAGVVDDYEVFATDVSERAIATAAEANYPRRAFRGDIDDLARAAFDWSGEGDRARARPLERLRERVRFGTLNLLDDVATRVPRCEIVLCRNVLIYMTGVARARVVAAIHERLVPGGALLLGHSETLMQASTPLSPWPVGRALVWRREAE